MTHVDLTKDEKIIFIYPTITLMIVGIFTTLGNAFEFYRETFIFEVLMFFLIGISLIYYLVHHPHGLRLKKVIGLPSNHWLVIIVLSVLLSIPWWFNECVELSGLTFYRRAFGIYAYSTLIKAPIYEEFYFRGIFLWFLRNRFNDNQSAMLNGLVFGSIHIGFITFGLNPVFFFVIITTSIYGILLAYIQIRTNNLMVPISFHFISNFIIIVIGFPNPPYILNKKC